MRSVDRDLSVDAVHVAGRLPYPVTLRLPPGSVTGLLGPNGCGKTTLLDVLSSRLPPTSGRVRLQGRAPALTDFNYLPQDFSRLLFRHLTLRQNIELLRPVASRNGVLPTLVDALFSDTDTLCRPPGKCSGGQKQRAALCRAIADVAAFPATLLDEPFSQLSREHKPLLYDSLRTQVAHSAAIALVVTHDIHEALLLSDFVAVFSPDGLTCHDARHVASPDDLLRTDPVRNAILGHFVGLRRRHSGAA